MASEEGPTSSRNREGKLSNKDRKFKLKLGEFFNGTGFFSKHSQESLKYLKKMKTFQGRGKL